VCTINGARLSGHGTCVISGKVQAHGDDHVRRCRQKRRAGAHIGFARPEATAEGQQLADSPPQGVEDMLDVSSRPRQAGRRDQEPQPGIQRIAVRRGSIRHGSVVKESPRSFPNIGGCSGRTPSLRCGPEDEELFEAGRKIGAFHYEKEWSFGNR